MTNSHCYLDQELEPRCARPLNKAIISPWIGTKIDAASLHPKPPTRPLYPLNGLNPDLAIIHRPLRFDQERVLEPAPGLGFDFADLAVEALFQLLSTTGLSSCSCFFGGEGWIFWGRVLFRRKGRIDSEKM